MGSTIGDSNANTAVLRDVNDGIRARLSGHTLPTPVGVVAELRQLVLTRLDQPSGARRRRRARR